MTILRSVTLRIVGHWTRASGSPELEQFADNSRHVILRGGDPSRVVGRFLRLWRAVRSDNSRSSLKVGASLVAVTRKIRRLFRSSELPSAREIFQACVVQRPQSEQTGTMVQMTSAEVETEKMDESARYFNYLRTLADLTALASIMAVQVIWGLCLNLGLIGMTYPSGLLSRLKYDVYVS